MNINQIFFLFLSFRIVFQTTEVYYGAISIIFLFILSFSCIHFLEINMVSHCFYKFNSNQHHSQIINLIGNYSVLEREQCGGYFETTLRYNNWVDNVFSAL